MATIIAQFVKPGDIRFTRVLGAMTPYTEAGGFYQFDQAPFAQSKMFWQMNTKYYQKRTYTDKVTVMVNTAAYGAAPEYPELELVDHLGTISIPLSIPSGPYVNGGQRIAGFVYTDPITGATTQYDSFQWKFQFNSLLSPTQNGLFYLRMRVYGSEAHTEYQDYISEPIFVYDTFPGTTLIEGKYLSNKSKKGVIVSGWNDGQPPTFQQRVEGFPLDYESESVNVGYLQQDYLYLQQLACQWRTWIFALGGISPGVPAYLREKVYEVMLTDIWQIDGKYFALNMQNNNAVSKPWKTTDPQTNDLQWSTIPIRERYENQDVFVTATPTADIEIVDFTADYPSAITPWMLDANFEVTLFNPGTFNDNTQRTAYLSYLNGAVSGGTFYFDGTTLMFTPVDGTPASLYQPPEMLFDYAIPNLKDAALGNEWGFIYNIGGTVGGPGKLVIDWDDTTVLPQYSEAIGSTTITHTFAGAPGTIRIFHNNLISNLNFYEDGGFFPVSSFLYGLSGDLPTGMLALQVIACDYFAQPGGGISDLDISMCTNIRILRFQLCPELKGFSVLFDNPLHDLRDIYFMDCPIDSVNVDDLVNKFVANVWNGTLTPGTYWCKNSPAAPPTGASLAARDALTNPPFTFWTLSFDP